jgi:hypothetical protein
MARRSGNPVSSASIGSSSRIALLTLLANMAGCDQLGLGTQAPVDDGAPSEQELGKISYMSTADSGAKGRKVYNHLEEAKTCHDFELAMRWNRPPNVEGGPFHRKMMYLSTSIPPDLPKQSEVFITARIDRGAMQPSGSAAWLLRMRDGSLVQAVEAANFWEKQQQDSQQGKIVALVNPTKPGRAFCGQGVYQGLLGKDSGQNANIPLFAMIFIMDRAK